MTIPAQSSARTLLQLLFRALPLTVSFVLAVVLSQTMQAQTFSVLHDFTAGADGAGPRSGITVGPGGVLYGTAEVGGPHGNGTVFKLRQMNSTWVFSTLYGFAGGSDGADPIGGVVIGALWRSIWYDPTGWSRKRRHSLCPNTPVHVLPIANVLLGRNHTSHVYRSTGWVQPVGREPGVRCGGKHLWHDHERRCV